MASRLEILLGAAVCAGALVMGCAGPTSGDDDDDNQASPTPPGFTLTDGSYDFKVDAVPADTCWAPPKTNPEVPMTIVSEIFTEGDTIHVTPVIDGVGSQEFLMARNGDKITGTSSDLLDLNDADTPIDCILQVTGTFDGVLVADDTFDALQTIGLAEAGGSACFLLVGTFDPNQVDQLPCSFTLEGTATLTP